MSFTDFPVTDKTLEGILRDLYLRSDQQARRGLPERVQAAGQYVTDYDLALDAGFYWSDVSTNGPPQAGTLTACLVARSDTRMIQELWTLTITDAVRVNTWRRVKSGTWRSWVSVGSGHNQGSTAITASLTPSAFEYGYNYAQGDATFPTGNVVVETVRYADVRAVQRVWAKGDDALQRWWYRQAIDGSTWGVWTLGGADSGWQAITVASGWSSTGGLAYRLRNNLVEFKGEFFGGTDVTTVFTLPAGYRPITRMAAPCSRIVTSSTPPWGTLNIATTGVATFTLLGGTIPASSPGFSTAQITFPVD